MAADFKLPGHLAHIGNSASALSAPKTLTETKSLDDLTPAPYQPRVTFDEAGLESLAASIREKGVVTPLLVRPLGSGKFEIIAGERRWRAARLAGLSSVPVTVRRLSDAEAEQVALLENIQREDLNAFEEVDSRLRIVASALGISRDEAPSRLNENLRNPNPADVAILEPLFAALGREKWESFAKNKLRVLNWPEPILAALRRGLKLDMAGKIAAAPEAMHADLIALALGGASRAEIEEEIKRARKPKKKAVTDYDRAAKLLGNHRRMAKLPLEKTERVQQLTRELLELLGES